MIPTDWELVKLQDTSLSIIDGDRGNNYPKSDDFTDNGYCLFLSAKNITKNGFRLEEKQFISEEKDNLLRKGKLKDLDIIITTRGSVGHIAYNENIRYDNIRINSGMVLLRNNDNSINQKYIYKLFASNIIQRQIEKIAFGSAQPQLTVKEINNLKIPLPPLKEQEKIADILSTADDKIDAIATQIEKAETLKKGLLQKLLSEGIGHSEFKNSELGKIPESWEVVKIVEVLDLMTDYVANGSFASLKENTMVYDSKEYAYYVRLFDLRRGLGHNAQKYVDEPTYSFLNKSFLEGNEILIANIGANVGESFLMPTLDMPSTLAPNMIELKLNYEKMTPLFCFNYLKSGVGLSELDKVIEGSGQPKINKTKLKTIKIPLPPLEEQKQIANILSTADEKLEVLRAKKEKYGTLKKGLLQKLLSGEVRV